MLRPRREERFLLDLLLESGTRRSSVTLSCRKSRFVCRVLTADLLDYVLASFPIAKS